MLNQVHRILTITIMVWSFVLSGSLSCGSAKEDAQTPHKTVAAQPPADIPDYNPSIISTGEWAQWRGPNRDGRSQETGLLKSWPPEGPKALWRIPLGEGFSGISITKEGRVYTEFLKDNDTFLVCLEAASGKELWRFRIGDKYSDFQGGDGPRGTPTVDGEFVYALTEYGFLYALNARTGAKIWSYDGQTNFGATVPQWGFSSSLLVEGEMLLAEVGGSAGKLLAAFNKTSGEILWTSQADKAGYSSPIAVTVDSIRQIIFFTGTKIMSVSPLDGKLFWQESWVTDYDVNAATPLFIAPDKLFISSGYGVGGGVYQMKTTGDQVSVSLLWKNEEMRNQMASSVLIGNYLYGFDEKNLKCMSAQTGDVKWSQRGLGKGTLLYADGHLIVLSDDGVLALVEATPTAYTEKARAEVLSGLCWTMPSLADGKLYIRNMEKLVCLDLKGN